MIDSLGDVGATLADANPTALTRLYKELNVSAVYHQTSGPWMSRPGPV